MDSKTSDPYVVISPNNTSSKKTKVQKKTLNPIWKEEILFDNFAMDFYNPGLIKIDIYDKDNFLNSDDLLGYV